MTTDGPDPMTDKPRFATRVVRAVAPPRSASRPLTPSIDLANVYVFDDLDQVDAVWEGTTPGYVYGRFGTANHALLVGVSHPCPDLPHFLHAEADVEEVVLAVPLEDVEVLLLVVLLVVVELLVVVVVLLVVLVVLLVVLVVLIVVVAEVELVEVVIATGEYVNVVVFQTGFVLIELDHEALTV